MAFPTAVGDTHLTFSKSGWRATISATRPVEDPSPKGGNADAARRLRRLHLGELARLLRLEAVERDTQHEEAEQEQA